MTINHDTPMQKLSHTQNPKIGQKPKIRCQGVSSINLEYCSSIRMLTSCQRQVSRLPAASECKQTSPGYYCGGGKYPVSHSTCQSDQSMILNMATNRSGIPAEPESSQLSDVILGKRMSTTGSTTTMCVCDSWLSLT